MNICAFCFQPVADDDPNQYRQVSSWVHGPKLDGPKLREQTGAVAHGHCVENLVHGQAADQPELFEEEPLVTDEPGGVYKVTGPNSMHTAIQARARDLQASGPDELPTGYYEWLAEKQIKEDLE